MICKYCGEPIPDKAMMCDNCNHPSTRGVRIVLIGFVLIVLIVGAVCGGIYIHNREVEKQAVQRIYKEFLPKMKKIADDYEKEVDTIIEDMKEDAKDKDSTE